MKYLESENVRQAKRWMWAEKEGSVKNFEYYVRSKCIVHGKLNFYLNNFLWFLAIDMIRSKE